MNSGIDLVEVNPSLFRDLKIQKETYENDDNSHTEIGQRLLFYYHLFLEFLCGSAMKAH